MLGQDWYFFILFFYVALRPRRRDDLLGTGTEWERGQGDWLDRRNRPKKTGETVDRRQNNGSVKAVSPRHCPATGILMGFIRILVQVNKYTT